MWNDLYDLEKKILIDSDVIRHFLRGNQVGMLKKIFPNNLYILKNVKDEICRSKKIRPHVLKLIKNGTLKSMPFPSNPNCIREFADLIKKFGEGEAACMAVARHTKDIIASNNLNDIKKYCEVHQISYLTTMDILYIAYERKIMNESQIDEFLYYNWSGANPSKIPFDTLAEFISSNPPILKLFRAAS